MSPKILIFDLELAPNIVSVWSLFKPMVGINQIIEPGRIICFSYRWYGSKKTTCVSEWDDAGYDGMIQKLWELFDEADVLCGYNSANFDAKHSNAAFLKAGLLPPAPSQQIDLLRVVRKHFNLPSRKLDYVCQALGIGAKTVHTGMDLWNECIRPTDETSGRKARNLMAKYCRNDVNLTHDLYVRLLPYLGNNVPVYGGDSEESRCSSCGSESIVRRGFAYTTSMRYRRYRCNDCGKWMRSARRESTTALRPT